jgi:DNA repair protein RecO (recombination protein O)
LGLLQELGFGLDLTHCAATGTTDDLTHVSPKSGRAVSAGAAQPYKAKLLALPKFLIAADEAPDIDAGLRLTGYFLETHVFHQRELELPAARQRLGDRFRARARAPD